MHRVQTLARTAAVALHVPRVDPLDTLRSVIVLGCALALIMAGPVLPQ